MNENEEFEFRMRAEQEAAHKPSAPQKKYDPTEGMGRFEQARAGFGKAFVDTGRAIEQRGAELGGALGLVSPETQQRIQGDVDEAKARDAPLMERGAARAGNVAGGIAATIPLAAVPGANTALGAAAIGGVAGALQPTASDESVGGNIVKGAVGGVSGKFAGDAASKGLGFVADKLGRIRPAPPTTEAGELLKKGYVLPPSYARVAGAKPSALHEALEGFGGKVKTEQAFSAKNQVNTNRLVRRALGLSEGESLTAEEVAQVRKDAGEVYEAVKQFKGQFVSDSQFDAGLQKIARTTTPVSKAERADIVQAPKQVTDLIEKLRGDYNPEEAVEIVKKLRLDGRLEAKSMDTNVKTYGRAKLQAAEEIDNLISRNLAKDKNSAGLFKAYKEARTLIARTYDVEKALNTTTGNISAKKLAKLAEKRPMGAELKDVADFAKGYEGAARTVEERGSRSGPSHSPLDYASAGLLALHHPAAGAAFLARPLARRYLASGGAQRAMQASAQPTLEQLLAPRAGELVAPQVLASYGSQH